jgi:hypothetical protein
MKSEIYLMLSESRKALIIQRFSGFYFFHWLQIGFILRNLIQIDAAMVS